MKNDKKEKYREISDFFQPLREVKKETIGTLADMAKSHRLLKYPIIAILFLFVFVYNLFLYSLINLKLRERLAKAMAVALSGILLISSVSLTAFAIDNISEELPEEAVQSVPAESDRTGEQSQGDGSTVEKEVNNRFDEDTIISIDKPEDTISRQQLKRGKGEMSINFPDNLNAVIYIPARTDATEPVDGTEDVQETGEESGTPSDIEGEEIPMTEEESDTETAPQTEENIEEDTGDVPTDVPAEETAGEEPADEETAEEEPAYEEEAQPSEEPAADESIPEAVEEQQEPAAASDYAAAFSVLKELKELFAPMPVFAMETEAAGEEADDAEELTTSEDETQYTGHEENIQVPVVWVLNAGASTSPEFNSGKAGETFVYDARIIGDYALAEDVALPQITVEIVNGAFVFDQTVSCNGVDIRVAAGEGVFPEDAVLTAHYIQGSEENKAKEAVSSVRDDNLNVAASLAFDIAVIDADGNEIEPDPSAIETGDLKVYFSLSKVENDNIEPAIYHIDEEAVELDSVVSGDTVSANTDGFSYYVVEFTYGDLTYVADGGSIIPLTDILEEVGLVVNGALGQPVSSNPALFDSFTRDGIQLIQLKQPFDTEEELIVPIGDISYSIKVTDDNGEPAFQWTETSDADTLVGTLLSGNLKANNATAAGSLYTFSGAESVVGFDHGIMLTTGKEGLDTYIDHDLEKFITSFPGASYGGHTSYVDFELTATGKLLNFNFAFASAEFTEDPEFNDCFGLFVSVEGGEWENIAYLPNEDGEPINNRYVSITAIRAGYSGTEMNSGASTSLVNDHQYDYFHTRNDSFPGGSVNGITSVFNAQKAVNKGDKVRIKMVIADASDTSVDSYVCIEGNSLSFDAPGSKPDYINEKLKELVPETDYEITVDGITYSFTADAEGTIPMVGTDKNGKEYNFIGKTLSVVAKLPEGDSEAQEVEIDERPTATDPSLPEADIPKPKDVTLYDVTTTTTSITIDDNHNNPHQQYSIDDGKTWKNPDENGKVVFDNLTPSETYKVKSRIPATEFNLASEPSQGTDVVTKDAIVVTANDTTFPYDKGTHSNTVEVTHPGEYDLVYSGEGSNDYTAVPPSFEDAGEHIIYYRVEADNCYPVYGSIKVIIEPRVVNVSTGSDTKPYDGTPLTCGELEVQEPDSTTGFLGDDGFANIVPVTSITDVGTVDNEVSYTFANGTNGNNYVINLTAGKLTVEPRELSLIWDKTEYEFNPGGIIPEAKAGNLLPGDKCEILFNPYINDFYSVGEYVAEATDVSNPNYKLPENPTHTIEIVPRVLTKDNTDMLFHGIDPEGNPNVTVSPSDQVYFTTMEPGDDYEIQDHVIENGKLKITIKGKNNYTGEVTYVFDYNPKVDTNGEIITNVNVEKSIEQSLNPKTKDLTLDEGRTILFQTLAEEGKDEIKDKIENKELELDYRASIYMTITDLNGDYAGAEEEIKSYMKAYIPEIVQDEVTLAKFFDISLYMDYYVQQGGVDIAHDNVVAIHESPVMHKITITIPEELRKASKPGYVREFQVYRVHEGGGIDISALLPNYTRNKSVTINTDKFSIYVIGYREVPAPNDPQNGGGNDSSQGDTTQVDAQAAVATTVASVATPVLAGKMSPKTGDTAETAAGMGLIFSGMIMLIGLFARKRKTE